MKAVFTTKVGSGYDDIVQEQYHFPATYLAQVRNAIGDLIVYYEPRRTAGSASGGRQAYFAVARVLGIEPDPVRDDHFYARIADYLDFDRPVSFELDGGYFESALKRADGETNRGAFGRSVRNIPDAEFEAILGAGFTGEQSHLDDYPDNPAELDEAPSEFVRPLVETTVTRPFRDRAFIRHVRQAYDRTCAITGLSLINGGGRPEVQAAHIQPVAHDGSDSIRNGIALSGTFHWMFDRGLISIDDDYAVLLSRKGIPDQVRRMINPTGRLLLPKPPHLRPHARYLKYHRDRVFKE